MIFCLCDIFLEWHFSEWNFVNVTFCLCDIRSGKHFVLGHFACKVFVSWKFFRRVIFLVTFCFQAFCLCDIMSSSTLFTDIFYILYVFVCVLTYKLWGFSIFNYFNNWLKNLLLHSNKSGCQEAVKVLPFNFKWWIRFQVPTISTVTCRRSKKNFIVIFSDISHSW